ncbi:MAG: hypothetical protein QOI41_316 [Myxococcales bacterium]|jgi:hypothetical protein|nr:hypothetical protein [Myxococcales bacterium]
MMGLGRALAAAGAIALTGCALISGAADLHVGEAIDGDEGGAALPDGAPTPREPTGGPDGSLPDPAPDASAPASDSGTRIREVTFESGSLTGLNGGDSVVGLPRVTTFDAIDGTRSMEVDNDNSYLETSVGTVDELYATYLVRLVDLNLGDTTVTRLVAASGGAPIDITLSKDRASLRVGGMPLNGFFPINNSNGIFRFGIHFRAGTGNGVVELFVAPRGIAFSGPVVSSSTLTLGRVTAVRLGIIGGGNVTLDFDDLFLDRASMPVP